MQRSTFILITAGITLLFGGTMFVAPSAAAEGFGFSDSPELMMMFRAVGEPLLAIGILNFLVRNERDSRALWSVLILNVVYHALALVNVAYSISAGIVLFSKAMPGVVPHVFIGIGSLIYALRMNLEADTSAVGEAAGTMRP